MGAATYLVELHTGVKGSFVANTSNIPSNVGVIHNISIKEVEYNTYWTDWGGGYYGLLDNSFVDIFINGKYLKKVYSLNDLKTTRSSMFTDGKRVYINIPPYFYMADSETTRAEQLEGYSTNVSDPLSPSNDKLNGNRYPTKLRVPSTQINLSDPVNGITITPTFTAQLNNGDGHFDNLNAPLMMYSPISILKSTTTPATYDTFKKIRVGQVENVSRTMDSISVSGADIMRTLTEPCTRSLKDLGYSKSDVLPLAFGDVKLDCIEISNTTDDITNEQTIVCAFGDPDSLTGLVDIYNSDDEVIGGYDDINYIYTFTIDTLAEGNLTPSYGKFKGKSTTNSTVAKIIIDTISQNTEIAYNSDNWNVEEVERYLQIAPSLNLVFSGGAVRDLVTLVLKSDISFLIQQNDGRLTIRHWGLNYGLHDIPKWIISQKPKMYFTDPKYFYSSVKIDYYEFGKKQYTNNSKEQEIKERWNKTALGEFKTNLKNPAQCGILATKILNRFGKRSQMIDISVGVDTSTIELLDTVNLEVIINGRKLTTIKRWRAMGINPAQDMLTMEEYEYTPTKQIDIPLSQPMIDYFKGYLSEPQSKDKDGLLSQQTLRGE